MMAIKEKDVVGPRVAIQEVDVAADLTPVNLLQRDPPARMDDEQLVAPGKEGFAYLLDEACRRLRIAASDRRVCWRALARRCHLDPTTLVKSVGRPSLPSWDTLQALARGTEIPLVDWLLALGVLTRADLEYALGSRTTAIDEPERALLDVLRAYPGLDLYWLVSWLTDWLRRMPPPGAHNANN